MEAFGDGKILVVIGKILRISYLHWNELNSDKLLCKLAKAFPRTDLTEMNSHFDFLCFLQIGVS